MEAAAVALGDGRFNFVVGDGRTIATKHFQALVIAINRLAAVVNCTDCAVGEFERNDGRIQIAKFSDFRGDEHITHDVEFFHFADLEAHHVKVVDCHVEEHAAGGAQVFQRGRFRVAAGNMQDARLADFSGCDDLMDALKTFIEAAVKANLQLDLRLVHHRQRIVDVF